MVEGRFPPGRLGGRKARMAGGGGVVTSQASSPASGYQSRSPGAAGSLSSWGLQGRMCILNLAAVSGARGTSVAGQHHHELCRRRGGA